MGSCAAVLGMLPIHILCAGWLLQPLLAPLPPPPDTSSLVEMDTDTIASSTLQPYHQHRPQGPAAGRLKEVLGVLCGSLPESVRIRSGGNHGMTPSEYLNSSMEDGTQKQECLEVLELGGTTGEDVEVTPTGPLEQLTEVDPNA